MFPCCILETSPTIFNRKVTKLNKSKLIDCAPQELHTLKLWKIFLNQYSMEFADESFLPTVIQIKNGYATAQMLYE